MRAWACANRSGRERSRQFTTGEGFSFNPERLGTYF